jgi:hypothetical protein
MVDCNNAGQTSASAAARPLLMSSLSFAEDADHPLHLSIDGDAPTVARGRTWYTVQGASQTQQHEGASQTQQHKGASQTQLAACTQLAAYTPEEHDVMELT